MSLLSLKHIDFTKKSASGEDIKILKNVNLTIRNREIVAILGRSGCGKSTILRIISGLLKASDGKIFFKDKRVLRATNAISMVFQNFALFPWLTVLQNIEIGLHNISEDEKRIRCAKIIEIIGLDGYESAYPRELSGGMKQRVGFARALVVNPNILLMDEPFSALDILTAQTLRTDFLDLWLDKKIPLKAAILVTHSIEEAVLIADRVKVMASDPGRIVGEVMIKLKHPRDRLSPEFRILVEEIYGLMTSKLTTRKSKSSSVEGMPDALFSHVESFLFMLYDAPYNGVGVLPIIADQLNNELDDLFPLVDGLVLLRFADISEDDIKLTSSGKIYVEGDLKIRRRILAEHLIQYVPLVGQIRRALNESSTGTVSKDLIIEEISKTLSNERANKIFKYIISWGRDAGLFSYSDSTKLISSKSKVKKR